MEVRQTIKLEIVKEKNTYFFEMPIGCQLTEAYDVCWSFLSSLKDNIDKAMESAKEEKAAADAKKGVEPELVEEKGKKK